MNMQLIAVFAENRPGQTAEVTKCLAEAHVSIHWVTIANSGTFGVMKFLVDRREEAVRALNARGFVTALIPVLAVEVENRPGSLQSVADCLARANLNLDNCSGFVANERAILIIETRQLEQASQALKDSGLRVLTQEEVLKV